MSKGIISFRGKSLVVCPGEGGLSGERYDLGGGGELLIIKK
jgi:hypothetical protein